MRSVIHAYSAVKAIAKLETYNTDGLMSFPQIAVEVNFPSLFDLHSCVMISLLKTRCYSFKNLFFRFNPKLQCSIVKNRT